MKRIILNEEYIQLLKTASVGTQVDIRREFAPKRYTNKSEYIQGKFKVGQEFFVAETISLYHKEKSGCCIGVDGYSADIQDYYKNLGLFQGNTSFSATNMPKDFSRFKLKVVGIQDITNNSTHWFTSVVRFQLIEKVEGRLNVQAL